MVIGLTSGISTGIAVLVLSGSASSFLNPSLAILPCQYKSPGIFPHFLLYTCPDYSTWNEYGIGEIHEIGYGFHGIGDGFHLHGHLFHEMCDGFHLHSTHGHSTPIPSSFHTHSIIISYSFHYHFILIPWAFHPHFTPILSSFHPYFILIPLVFHSHSTHYIPWSFHEMFPGGFHIE